MLEYTHEVVCEYNIMHGIEVWVCGEARNEFGKIHSRLCKKIMAVPNCAANGFAEIELGRESRRGKCIGRTLKYRTGSCVWVQISGKGQKTHMSMRRWTV